ncbi:MAG: hypothetical protein GY809_00840 [Planctomycetes bacterium]|nr:hypothetical protein [Planctomycetota bacterium]
MTPFLATRSAVVGVRFAMEYDDGYIAYINGVPVHSQHTPNSPGHDQPASSNHEADCPGTFDPIDMSESLDLLVPGLNLLALQVHNGSQSSSDFIFVPQLFGVK